MAQTLQPAFLRPRAHRHALETRQLFDGAAPVVEATREAITVAEPSEINDPGADVETLSGWTVTDDGPGPVTVSALVDDPTKGQLASPGMAGVTVIPGGFQFTGSAAEASAWLNQLQFIAADVELGATEATTAITVTVTDAGDPALTDTHFIPVRITPSNDPSSIESATTPVGEGVTTVLTTALLAAIDSEVGAGAQTSHQITYGLTAAPAHGYLTLGGVRLGVDSVFTAQDVIDGRLAYVHTATGAQQNSADSFAVQVNDGATPLAASDTAVLSMTITPVNQLPTVSGSATAFEGQPANGQLLSGQPLSVGSAIEADGGGDDSAATLQIAITALPGPDGVLHFQGTVEIGGVSQVIDREITAADVAAGFRFAYSDRAGLTYRNLGNLDSDADPASGYPLADSFGIQVIDGGGATGTPGTVDAVIPINVTPINDDPALDSASTLFAQVTPAGDTLGTYDGPFVVTLTPAMLNATDVDSDPSNLSFVVPSLATMAHGRLLLNGELMPAGSRFTLADVQAGAVQYVQFSAAQPGETDSFQFELVDSSGSLRWNADGSALVRVGGVYDDAGTPGQLGDDTLKAHTFTIGLASGLGNGGDGFEEMSLTVTTASSTYAGVDATGNALGTLAEGGTILIRGTTHGANDPFLSYVADDTPPSEVIYTVVGYETGNADAPRNGALQRFDGASWVDIAPFTTFTQEDLDTGRIRFQHDGAVEDFESQVHLSVSAGVFTNGQLDVWSTTLTMYATPVNDAPTVSTNTQAVVAEGSSIGISTAMLGIGDPDDAVSEAWVESGATLPDGSDNYAVNHSTSGPDALNFVVISTLPTGGTLRYTLDGGATWVDVVANSPLDASILTGDNASTGLRFFSDGSEWATTSFDVRAIDRWGQTSAPATVTIVQTPVNDPPVLPQTPTEPVIAGAANQPLTVVEGGVGQITSALLHAADPDNGDDQIQYHIVQSPAQGWIGIAPVGGGVIQFLGTGSSFTQAQVDAGQIWYVHAGDETNGSSGLPDPPADEFLFDVSDGNGTQAASRFWIYVRPTNDAPTVVAPAVASIPVDGEAPGLNPVTGFQVTDADTDSAASLIDDQIRVTVRLVDAAGVPQPLAAYTDVTLTSSTAAPGVIDATANGAGGVLVLNGTRAEVDQALAGLQIGVIGDRNAIWYLQVVADDRLRDGGGTLTGVANGGDLNDRRDEQLPPSAVPTTEFDPYADTVSTAGPLAGNLTAAQVALLVSNDNQTASLGAPATATVYEDQATPIAGPFIVADAESAAFDLPVTVTFSVPQGQLAIAGGAATSWTPGGGMAVTVGGNGGSTLTLTGRASDIQTLLNSGAATGLTWRGPANMNHDVNGAAAGDVTLTMSLDDAGARIGDDTGAGSQADLPAPRTIALTVVPVNDPPTVTLAPGVTSATVVPLTGGASPTAVPGFLIGDVDLGADGDGQAAGETDTVRVTVRLTDALGIPLSNDHYDGTNGSIVISTSTVGSGATTAPGLDGNQTPLVITGTRAQVQAWLDGLQVAVGAGDANADAPLRVEVVIDDRLDAMGTPDTTANGGKPAATGGGTGDAPTAAVDPWGPLPAGLGGHVASQYRTVLATQWNDPAELTGTVAGASEASATWTLNGLTLTDDDALTSDVMRATVSVPAGFSIASVGGAGGTVVIAGDGRSVTIDGTMAQINSRLAAVTVALPDAPGAALAADWNGEFTVTVAVDDLGNNGGRPSSVAAGDETTTGRFSYADGTSNHLVTTRVIDVTIAPRNDAPGVAGVGAVNLVAVAEDSAAATIPGATVASLVASRFSDAADAIDNSGVSATGGSSADSLQGIAISGLALNAAQGAWQYSTDGGTSWTAVGARTEAQALILAGSDQLRFVPAANFHGTPAALTVRLVETDANADSATAVPAGGSVVDLTATGVGGRTVYSAGTLTVQTSVTGVNDRPTLSNATLAATTEDVAPAAAPGATAQSLFGALYGDAIDNRSAIAGGGNSASAFGGLAIVGNAAAAAEGVWQTSSDGGASWVDVPTDASDTQATLITTTTRIRFLPADDFNGAPGALTVRAADTPVTAGTADIAAAAANATGTWSAARTLGTTVAARNDAPAIAGTVDVTATENDQTGTGTSITPVRLLAAGTAEVSDIDAGTTAGIASGAFGAGTLTVSLDAWQTGDRLLVDGSLPAGATASGGVLSSLVISFGPATTTAQVQAVLAALAWQHSGDDPTAGGTATDRTYRITLNDGNNQQPGGIITAGGPTTLDSNTLVGLITVEAVNDPPTARTDTHTMTDTQATVAANVISGRIAAEADRDPDDTALAVSAIRAGALADGGTTVAPGTDVTGTWGSLAMSTNGAYVYTLDTEDPRVQALVAGETLTERFTYTIVDPDGLTASAELVITISGSADGSAGDQLPAITIADGNGSAAGQGSVAEAGLTGSTDTSETTTGSLAVTAADGLTGLEIAGEFISLAALQDLGTTPVEITTPLGTLTLTGLSGITTTTAPTGPVVIAATVSWQYTLDRPAVHGATPVTDSLAVTVIDRDNDRRSASLTIAIADDQPTAADDDATITEDAAPATVSGNVRTDDRLGADNANGVPVTALSFDTVTVTPGSVLTTTYGQITMAADGQWTYTLDNDNAIVNALKSGDSLTETIHYQLTDNDGDTSTAALTITIQGSTDAGTGPSITPVLLGAGPQHAEVHEAGLVDGPTGADARETTTGLINVVALDGLETITVGGQTVTLAELADLDANPIEILTDQGVLTLTGFTATESVGGVPTRGQLAYGYTLSQAITHAADRDDAFEPVALAVADAGGGNQQSTLTIRIVDDQPLASDDAAQITEDTPGHTITGDITGNDRVGADDGNGVPVTAISRAGTSVAPGTAIAGRWGTFTVQSDGQWQYTLNNALPEVQALTVGETLTDTVSITRTDADGDRSSADLVITIAGADDGATLSFAPDLVDTFEVDPDDVDPSRGLARVSEAGLTDGDGSTQTAGSFSIRTPDGLGSLTVGDVTLLPADLADAAARPITIATAHGHLQITGFDPQTGVVRWQFSLDRSANHGAGPVIDTLAMVVRDRDGDATTGQLAILIANDAPLARDDAATISTAFPNPVINGNVVSIGAGADRVGADATATPVTAVGSGDEPMVAAGTPLAGRYGTLVLQPDGSYRYAVDSSQPEVAILAEGRTLTDVFRYVITDADGQSATALLTVTIRGSSNARPLTTAASMPDIVWPDEDRHERRDFGQAMQPALFIHPAVEVSRQTASALLAVVGRRVAGEAFDLDLPREPQTFDHAQPVRDIGLSTAWALQRELREQRAAMDLTPRLERHEAIQPAASFSQQMQAAARVAGLTPTGIVAPADAALDPPADAPDAPMPGPTRAPVPPANPLQATRLRSSTLRP